MSSDNTLPLSLSFSFSPCLFLLLCSRYAIFDSVRVQLPSLQSNEHYLYLNVLLLLLFSNDGNFSPYSFSCYLCFLFPFFLRVHLPFFCKFYFGEKWVGKAARKVFIEMNCCNFKMANGRNARKAVHIAQLNQSFTEFTRKTMRMEIKRQILFLTMKMIGVHCHWKRKLLFWLNTMFFASAIRFFCTFFSSLSFVRRCGGLQQKKDLSRKRDALMKKFNPMNSKRKC